MSANDAVDSTLEQMLPQWIWKLTASVFILALAAACLQTIGQAHTTDYYLGGILLAVASLLSLLVAYEWWSKVARWSLLMFGLLTIVLASLTYMSFS